MAIAISRFYAINRSTNSVYYSDDLGSVWTEIASNVSTSEASDIGANPLIFNDILVLNGANAPGTPYLSVDGGSIFAPGANISGKEIIYASSTCIVAGGKRLKSNTGPEISISVDGGLSFSRTIDTTRLYSYPGANFGSITVMSVDFTSPAGGYIAIAGKGDNSNADQIIARTYDRGNSFPDAIILDGNIYGVIRSIYATKSGNILFVAGEPSLAGRAKIYKIDKALTDIPVEVYSGVTAGSLTNASITKFFTLPNRAVSGDTVYFVDSSGQVLISRDAGETWQLRRSLPATCVDAIVDYSGVIMALTYSPNVIYRSFNDAQTWDQFPQPAWNNPEALAYNELATCDSCVTGYTDVGDLNDARYCVAFPETGPICKPPYQYFAIDKRCATPGALVPTNIVYAIDQSSSVTPDENLLFKEFIVRTTNELSDRLDTGAIEISVIKWADTACLVLPFTSNKSDIVNSVISDSISCPIGLFTSHVDAFCLSTRTMYEKSILKPEAKNVLIVFTDGKNNVNQFGCNLSDINLTPEVPPDGVNGFSSTFLKLAKNAKETLAGVGMDIFVVGVGEINERQEIELSMIDEPLAAGEEPYPSKSLLGNYYYFDGGDFTDIEYVASQIRLGLGASTYDTPECPEGCVGLPGIDGLGYCSCEDRQNVVACLYKLIDCNRIIPPIYSTDDALSRHVDFPFNFGAVITLQPVVGAGFFYQPGCYEVERVPADEIPSIPASSIFEIVIGTGFADCPACATPTYIKFTDCIDEQNIVFSIEDINSFGADLNKPVVKSNNVNYSGTCWRFELDAEYINGAPIFNSFVFSIIEQYTTCPECLPVEIPSYKCTDCETNLPDIYTQSDLSIYAGQHAKFLQYPNICWSVSLTFDINVSYETLTPDGIPYGLCSDCLPSPVITYTLAECGNEVNQIATDSNLGQYVDQVVKLTTTGDTCWSVSLGSLPNLVLQPVSISQSFLGCQDCYPQIFEFINCQEPGIKVYTLIDFSAYVGQVVNLQEYPGICWTVDTTDDRTLPRQDLTIQGNPFIGCSECLVTYFQLTNCVNPDIFLISSTDLSIYMGRTITLAGYPSLCFTVSEPKCDCILVSVDNINYTAYAEPSLFNGKKRYIFETDSGDTLGIAWNTNPNQWELFDITTLETYGFSILDSVCPFSNFWTVVQGAPHIITSIGFCAERIFNVAPELDFDNCLPCIKCI
jgi:hypothetical protein